MLPRIEDLRVVLEQVIADRAERGLRGGRLS